MTPQDPSAGKMTQSSVRAANLALVLSRIPGEEGSVSRADIAAQLGMTRSTVSRLIDDLIVGRLVREGETSAGGRGRPAVPLNLQRRTVVSLGLEVNVERLVATLVDLTGEVLVVRQRDLDVVALDPADAMAQLAELAEEAIASRPDRSRLAGATLALPGLLDRSGTRVLRAPNLGWEGVEPSALWRLSVDGEPVALRSANDIDCSALTVLRDDPQASFIYVTGEVGIGSAVAINGEILAGRSGWAAELGHVCVDPHGHRCGCGSIGCLESVAGARGLLRDSGQPDVASLIAAAEAGEGLALATIEGAADALGIALSAALNLLDVENIRLGGHLGQLEPFMRERLSAVLNQRVLWARHSGIEVEVVERAPLRAAMGAGLAGLSQVIADPSTWIDELLVD